MQALDAAVHWMAWLFQQHAIPMEEILPADTQQEDHAALQLLDFLAEMSSVDACDGLVLEASGQTDLPRRLLYHSLQWLIQVQRCKAIVIMLPMSLPDTLEFCSVVAA